MCRHAALHNSPRCSTWPLHGRITCGRGCRRRCPIRGEARMRFRRLRIAFSATFGIVCVLLVAMWIGSYGENHRSFSVGRIGWRSEQGVLSSFSPFDLIDDRTDEEPQSVSIHDTITPRGPPVLLEP